MEGGYTGVSCVRHSEHRDIDPVWKETDERGENRLFRDSGKDIVDLHQRLSFFSQETSAGCRPYSPWFPWGGEGPMIPGYKARWATGRQWLTPMMTRLCKDFRFAYQMEYRAIWHPGNHGSATKHI